MAENKKYLLELDEAHVKALLPALDLAARLHLGQLGMVAEYLAFNVNTPIKASPYSNTVRNGLMEVKGAFFESGNLGAGYGIHNPEVSETARLLLDVHDVLRHRIAWDEAGNPPKRTKEMMQVWYDEVHQLADSVELPKATRVVPGVTGGIGDVARVLQNILIHFEYLCSEEIRVHGYVAPDHDIDFQVFRVLTGYSEALEELSELRKQLAEENSLGDAT